MRKTLSLFIVAAFSLNIYGCETARQTGALTGTTAGAAIGASVSKDKTTGAVIGGILGYILGSAIGQYADEQAQNRQEAIRSRHYQSTQGKMIRIENASVAPTAIRAGEHINLSVRYCVLSPNPNEQLKVRETRYVQKNGVDVMRPMERVVTREQGVIKSSIASLPIPRDAQAGYYEVITVIDDGQVYDRRVSRFRVQPI